MLTGKSANLIAVFALLGYVTSERDDEGVGTERLALFANEHGEPTHVARQLPSGVWTSKLGSAEDIEHDSLAALEGPIYGPCRAIHVPSALASAGGPCL